MKVIRHLYDALNSDIVWQDAVESVRELSCIEQTVFRYQRQRRARIIIIPVEVCHHHARVHPCISAPSASDAYLPTHDSRQTFFKRLLHRNAIGLHLPPVVSATIVREIDKEPHKYDIYNTQSSL